MNKKTQQKNKGFTIVEAIIAIFILSISIGAMLGLTVSSYSTAKYANNEITANYLLQEAIDSVRNSRDTIAFQMKDTGGGWQKFLDRYGSTAGNKCFTTNGCVFKMDSFNASDTSGNDIISCSGSGCLPFYYDGDATNQVFYNLNNKGTPSSFKRQVKMTVNPINLNEVEIIANVEYRNGTSVKTRTLKMNLMNWQAD